MFSEFLSISNCVKELLNNFINDYAYICVNVNRYTCLIIHIYYSELSMVSQFWKSSVIYIVLKKKIEWMIHF
jgi:predicted HD phosphohydrolase